MRRETIANDFLEVEYMTASLRISGLTPKGKSNLFADVRHLPAIATPYGDFHLHGGHRLWHAPESMPRTYMPDNGDLIITKRKNSLALEAQTEPGTGIRKRIELQLDSAAPTVRLTHSLTNNGAWTVKLAPWAITQLRLGGTAVLPMPAESVDQAGLLPNRHISFWPYADLADPRLRWQNDYLFFDAVSASAFKLGYFNTHGWLGYWLDGVFFKKSFFIHMDAEYPDHGCNAEIYCNENFLELESLAPLVYLEPGAGVQHREVWEISTTLAEQISERI